MKKKSKVFIFRRGYWQTLAVCAFTSLLYGFKYTVVLKQNPGALDIKKGLLSTAVLFIISATASMLAVRWYYKLKDKGPGHSR